MDDYDREEADATHQAWLAAHERLQQAQADNTDHVGHVRVGFSLAIDPAAIVGPLYLRKLPELEVMAGYLEAVEAGLALGSGDVSITAVAEPWGGPKTGGPIPDQTQLVQIVGLAFGGAAAIVVLVDFVDVVHRLLAKAKELTRNEVSVSNGLAIILAAEAIDKATGERDLQLAFASALNGFHSVDDEMVQSFDDGWMIGFRSADRIRVVHVDRLGRASIADSDIDVTWASR